jgi:hypothetical protein
MRKSNPPLHCPGLITSPSPLSPVSSSSAFNLVAAAYPASRLSLLTKIANVNPPAIHPASPDRQPAPVGWLSIDRVRLPPKRAATNSIELDTLPHGWDKAVIGITAAPACFRLPVWHLARLRPFLRAHHKTGANSFSAGFLKLG